MSIPGYFLSIVFTVPSLLISGAESLKLLEVNRGNSYSSVSLESATAQSMVAVPTLDRFGLQAPMPLHQEAELLTDGVI